MTKHRTPLRILLALGWYDYRLQRGIERYARKRGWSVRMDLTRDRTIPWGWDGDGILAWLDADDELAEFVARAQKPTVDFGFRRPHLKFGRVLEDTAAAARMVAEHLLARGVRNFLFCSDAQNWVYDERGKHFVAELQRLGYDACWLRWHEATDHDSGYNSWTIKRRWLMEGIRKVDHPVGIFAASDELASHVLDACEFAAIRVPDEAAIIGAGDSLLAVDSMNTPISSVDTNLELLGYRGAQELDGLMRERCASARPKRIIRIPPTGVITRKSSDPLAVPHPGVARSLRFLMQNAYGPLVVSHLAKAASMSQRPFRSAFLACVGRGPGAEIRRVRMEKAKGLLRRSHEKLSVIAGECGYKNGNSFSIAFKKTTGLTPGEYRTSFVVPD